jgi:hypothetical protein
MYGIKEGEYLVKLARQTIEGYLRDKRMPKVKDVPEKLKEKAGVFVTLETYPAKNLRGCIGYPEPVLPLVEALCKAAVSAATQDPRFPPLLPTELGSIIIEVSVLTKPELIKASPKEYPKEIVIGRHGLIAERGLNRGLLLPQVAVDEKWSKEEFLSHTCMKAGLLPDAWLQSGTKIYRFEGIVFTEVSPNGKIVERKLE